MSYREDIDIDRNSSLEKDQDTKNIDKPGKHMMKTNAYRRKNDGDVIDADNGDSGGSVEVAESLPKDI